MLITLVPNCKGGGKKNAAGGELSRFLKMVGDLGDCLIIIRN